MNISNNDIYLRNKEAQVEYIIRKPKIETFNPPVLYLLHGLGSNEQDLFSFAEHLPANFLVISVRAPYTIGLDSYSWYHVDFTSGDPIINRKEADKSRNMLIQFIALMQQEYQFDPNQVFLCGFSQGAIMSYSIGLTRPDLIKGIALMSGRLPDETKSFVATDEKLKNLAVFISHGIDDAVLPIQYAREGLEYLQTRNIKPTYKEYPAGHTINKEMLTDLVDWLNKIV
ncbi:MAG: esterase [Bacteroidota bacterium]